MADFCFLVYDFCVIDGWFTIQFQNVIKTVKFSFIVYFSYCLCYCAGISCCDPTPADCHDHPLNGDAHQYSCH